MEPSGTPALERETIIRWDDEDKVVTIWTAAAPVYRKLIKAGVQPSETSLRRDGTMHGATFRFPLDKLKWRVQLVKRKGPAKGFVAKSTRETMQETDGSTRKA